MKHSIPIIELRRIFIVSIQTDLSDRLVAALREDIAREIASRPVRGLVLEVSGVDVFDSYIAASVRNIAHVARLLGVETVLAGLDPAMAITLVEMGLEMQGVRTALDLDSAFDALERETRELERSDDDLLATILGPQVEGSS